MNEKKVFDAYRQRSYDTHTYTRIKNIGVQQVAFSSIPSAPISPSNCLFLDCCHFVHLLFAIHVTQRFFSSPQIRLLIANKNTEIPKCQDGAE
jgi:hypothetical protein